MSAAWAGTAGMGRRARRARLAQRGCRRSSADGLQLVGRRAHQVVGPAELLDALLPVVLLAQQLVDLVVEVADLVLREALCMQRAFRADRPQGVVSVSQSKSSARLAGMWSRMSLGKQRSEPHRFGSPRPSCRPPARSPCATSPPHPTRRTLTRGRAGLRAGPPSPRASPQPDG